MDYLLDDGDEFGPDVGLEWESESPPDVGRLDRHNTSY
jgi:hypothetical protein